MELKNDGQSTEADDLVSVKRLKSSHFTSEKLVVERWLDLVYPSDHCIRSDSAYFEEISRGCTDIRGIIIDDPQNTLRNAMLDFDVAEAVGFVTKAAARPSGNRSKPVVALSRGVGGGKTRALVEIQRRLAETNCNVLTAAVTFNNLTKCCNDKWLDPSGRKLTKKDSFALSFIARIGFSFFDHLSSDYGSEVKRIMSLLPRLLGTCASAGEYLNSPITLIRGIVKHIFVRSNVTRNEYAKIKTILVMLDEILEMDEHLVLVDSSSVLREALLDCDFIPGVNVTLLMSTLSSTTYAEMISGRGIRMLNLPDRLSLDSIIHSWWNIPASTLNEREQALLRLIAASMDSLPRVIEFACAYFRDNYWVNSDDGGMGANIASAVATVPLDSAFVADLYRDLFEQITERYRTHGQPGVHILYAIFFGQPLQLTDEGVIEAVNLSIITNSLKDLDLAQQFIPETSIVRLKALFDQKVVSKDPKVRAVAPHILHSVNSILAAIPTIETHNVGKLLEIALCESFSNRILLASTVAYPGVLVSEILGLSSLLALDRRASTSLPSALSAHLLFHRVAPPTVNKMEFFSGANFEAWVRQLEQVSVNSDSPMALILPIENGGDQESWDLCVKVCTKSADQAAVLYVFIDAKSGGEVESSSPAADNKTNILELMKENREQYFKVKKLASNGNLKFMYIYASTHAIASQLLDSSDSDPALAATGSDSDGGEVCVFMGREDTKTLLGPIFGLYCAMLRATFT